MASRAEKRVDNDDAEVASVQVDSVQVDAVDVEAVDPEAVVVEEAIVVEPVAVEAAPEEPVQVEARPDELRLLEAMVFAASGPRGEAAPAQEAAAGERRRCPGSVRRGRRSSGR